MKRRLSLRMEICAFSILPGVIFLLCTISDLFIKIPDVAMAIVAVVTCTIWCIVTVMHFCGRAESEDEMARKNLNRARTVSWGALILELSGLGLYLIFSGKPILLTEDAVFIMLSSAHLIYGVVFLALDKYGKA